MVLPTQLYPRLATYSEWFVEEEKGAILFTEEILCILNIEELF